MISSIFSRLTVLTFGTLYPAYYSFKTVRAKSVDEYMKWMMYWIVFAIFTAAESFTDIFLKWLPFYYELKIITILWLLPSMGNGSPIIYRKCIHPFLKKHETRVDRTLVQLKHKGQDMIFHYASEAVLFLGRSIMNIVHKNIPNGILGLLASNHDGIGGMSNGRRSTLRPVANSTLVIEEVDPPSTSSAAAGKMTTRRKSPARTVKAVDDTLDLQSSNMRRGRKGRHTKLDSDVDLDINLNESH